MPTEGQGAKVLLVRSVHEVDRKDFDPKLLTVWIKRARQGENQARFIDRAENLLEHFPRTYHSLLDIMRFPGKET